MKRNPDIAKNFIQKKDGSLVTKDYVEIHIPTYFPKELVSIEETIKIVGSFAFVKNNEYAVMSSLSVFTIKPTSYHVEKDYHVFGFAKGDVVIETNNVLIDAAVIHPIFDNYLFKAKIPWYLEYEDVSKLLLFSNEDTGLDIDISPPIMDLLVSTIASLKNGKGKVRHNATMKNKIPRDEILYSAMDSVFNVDNTLNKIMGNHQNNGMLSALTTDDDGAPSLTEDALLS